MKDNKKKIIWLASFPRSGNTMVRSALNDLYDVFSYVMSHYNKHKDEMPEMFVLKTHKMYKKLGGRKDLTYKSIYIIRDGRDAYVSLAHHKKDIIDVGSDFEANIREGIVAAKESYFGGWTKNIRSWLPFADYVVRYEDLVDNTPGVLEPIRKEMGWPEPKIENLKSFETLKAGKGVFGRTDKVAFGNPRNHPHFSSEKFFRKGKAGNWKSEMTEDVHALFWKHHGRMMKKLGYGKDGSWVSKEEFDKRITQLKANPLRYYLPW